MVFPGGLVSKKASRGGKWGDARASSSTGRAGWLCQRKLVHAKPRRSSGGGSRHVIGSGSTTQRRRTDGMWARVRFRQAKEG